jgi:2-amino-4-hydroxy-6-hydroxymethyldihydropteridine diphosphokinase
MDNYMVYLLLGSNLGNREYFINEAIRLIREKIGNLVSKSSVYETEPWGFTGKQYFLNQATGVVTSLSPRELLAVTTGIEHELGRTRRGKKYQNRTIDIDILFYEDRIIDSEDLKIPHPLLQERKFVLVAMAEIAGDFIHPVLHKSIRLLLDECKDTKAVRRII